MILSTIQDSVNDEEDNIAEDELPDIPEYGDNDDDQENTENSENIVVDPEKGKQSSRKRKRHDSGQERRSKRLAEKPNNTRKQLEALGLVKGERLWKEFEKKLFLDACKQFGSKDSEKIAAKVPTKTPAMVKNLIAREKRNQNFTIETRFVHDETSESIVLDDGEDNKNRIKTPENIDVPEATPQGKIVEVLKRRKRNAPIEMWIDITEKKVANVDKKLKGENAVPSDYSVVVSNMLQVRLIHLNLNLFFKNVNYSPNKNIFVSGLVIMKNILLLKSVVVWTMLPSTGILDACVKEKLLQT